MEGEGSNGGRESSPRLIIACVHSHSQAVIFVFWWSHLFVGSCICLWAFRFVCGHLHLFMDCCLGWWAVVLLVWHCGGHSSLFVGCCHCGWSCHWWGMVGPHGCLWWCSCVVALSSCAGVVLLCLGTGALMLLLVWCAVVAAVYIQSQQRGDRERNGMLTHQGHVFYEL